MSRRNGIPSSSKSSITSARTIFACRSSSSVLTSGNITRTSPHTLARSTARNCVLKEARFCKLSRMLRRPSALSRCPATPRRRLSETLSAPRSIVRITTGRAVHRGHDAAVGLEVLLLGRLRVALEVQELRAVQADPVAAGGRLQWPTSSGNSMLPITNTRSPSRGAGFDVRGRSGAGWTPCGGPPRGGGSRRGVSSSGSISSSPRCPSTITVSPPATSDRNRPTPTTAGSSRAPARIAVWLVRPPPSVTNARIFRAVQATPSRWG